MGYFLIIFIPSQICRSIGLKAQLHQLGAYNDYMTKLFNAFNPHTTAEGLMCRSLISVGYDGKLYDCDFNQMLEMQIFNGEPMTVFQF